MIIKYWYGKLYPEFSIHAPLILEGWMVMFSLTYPPWNSITEKKIEYLHRIIIRLQQGIILSGQNVSPTIILFRYMKALSNIDKLKEFIAPKMTYLVTFLDNNRKLAVYKGRNIHGLYSYIEMIGFPTTLTTSGWRYHPFGTSCSINNDTETLHPVISDLCTRKKIICECCGRIWHKDDVCIIHEPKFFPQSLRRNRNKFNALHGEEPTDTPREQNSQPTVDHFKSRNSPPKTSPVVSYMMGRLNHHDIDNGDFEFHPSEFPVESNSESVKDPDTTSWNQFMIMKWNISSDSSTQKIMKIFWMFNSRCFIIDRWKNPKRCSIS